MDLVRPGRSERLLVGGETFDVYRLNINIRTHEPEFIWNLSKSLKDGSIKYQIEWDLDDGSVLKSQEKFTWGPMNYNLSQASDRLCSKGFYSNFNPFSTADVFQKLARVESTLLGGRCNDMGHPYGGVFNNEADKGHKGKGHKRGLAIDMRYPNSALAGGADGTNNTQIDEFDRTDRKAKIDNLSNWISQLRSLYSSQAIHDSLESFCFDDPGFNTSPVYLGCSSLSKLGSGQFSLRSLSRFCQVASTDGEISSTNFTTYCSGFPQEDAIAISMNVLEIRNAIDSVVSIRGFENTEFKTGIGWFSDMLNKGGFKNNGVLYPLMEYNEQTSRFSNNIFDLWNRPFVKPTDKHTDHIHVNLF